MNRTLISSEFFVSRAIVAATLALCIGRSSVAVAEPTTTVAAYFPAQSTAKIIRLTALPGVAHLGALAQRHPQLKGVVLHEPVVHKPIDPKLAPRDPYAMSAAYRASHGVRLPSDNGTTPAIPAVRHTSTIGSLHGPTGSGIFPRPLPTLQGGGAHNNSQLAASWTGFKHWWSFEEDTIPGVGKFYANVNSAGNVVVQADRGGPG
jgi:hypothetical protein